jgi:hypothetical protein
MLLEFEIPEDYWDLTHDKIVPGVFNCPKDTGTWDWEGGLDDPDPLISLNGSDPMDLKTLGHVLRKMVDLARKKGVGDYEIVDLSP